MEVSALPVTEGGYSNSDKFMQISSLTHVRVLVTAHTSARAVGHYIPSLDQKCV
jgi:hypothetical protein